MSREVQSQFNVMIYKLKLFSSNALGGGCNYSRTISPVITDDRERRGEVREAGAQRSIDDLRVRVSLHRFGQLVALVAQPAEEKEDELANVVVWATGTCHRGEIIDVGHLAAFLANAANVAHSSAKCFSTPVMRSCTNFASCSLRNGSMPVYFNSARFKILKENYGSALLTTSYFGSALEASPSLSLKMFPLGKNIRRTASRIAPLDVSRETISLVPSPADSCLLAGGELPQVKSHTPILPSG